MGVVALNYFETHRKLSFIQIAAGGVPSPFDCWLAYRGLKTLHLRAPAAARSALAVANSLASSSFVLAVNYPGLENHPDRYIALKQHRDGMGGSMFSFRIRGGTLPPVVTQPPDFVRLRGYLRWQRASSSGGTGKSL